MKYPVQAIVLMSILASCNGGSGGSGSSSPNAVSIKDVCAAGDCSDRRDLTVEEAKAISIRLSENEPEPEIGLSISHTVKALESTYDYNYETQTAVISGKCETTYNRTKLILDYDDKYFYYERKKTVLSVSPETEKCQQHAENNHSDTGTIFKDDRTDPKSAGIRDEDNDSDFEDFKNMTIQMVNYNGIAALYFAGTYPLKYTNEKGEEMSGTSTVNSLTDLTASPFTNTIAQSVAYSASDFSSVESESNRVIKRGVDVSHIDIDSLNDDQISDITDEAQAQYETERESSFSALSL